MKGEASQAGFPTLTTLLPAPTFSHALRTVFHKTFRMTGLNKMPIVCLALIVLALGRTSLAVDLTPDSGDMLLQVGNPSYQGKDPCPAHCAEAGAAPSNWSVYHNIDQLQRCTQNLFLDFTLDDPVDDSATLHRLRACTIWGSDWRQLPLPSSPVPATEVNATIQVGSLYTASGDAGQATARLADAVSLVSSIANYLARGFGSDTGATILLALSGNASAGLYLGSALQREGTGTSLIQGLAAVMSDVGIANGFAAQLCEPGRAADHVFGLAVATNNSFAPVQNALRNWRDAKCVDDWSSGPQNLTRAIYVTAPPLYPVLNDTDVGSNGTVLGNNSSTPFSSRLRRVAASRSSLEARADCTTIQVASGDSCASLAAKCGISGNVLMTYNTQANFCSTLQPYQHVCCTSGTLPNYKPQPNSDGSCATYTTVSGDSCYAIAAARSLTPTDLENFNKNTWGWNGCSNIWVGVRMCLSTGTPPMPAPVANSVCGPQVPGTAAPPSGTDLGSLNPCPLNACCDVWGQCGTTAEFCTNTSTGAPGTAKVGTNGCISNCGTSIIQSGNVAWHSIAYFEGFNLGRSCVYMDASQIDTTQHTHVHYAFATLTADYQVVIGDAGARFEFKQFLALKGVKRILSFGGWDFSTGPTTYSIFRNGVTAANRQTLAHNIADFIYNNGLDGVDIDWEYPGAPDIPGIPPADPGDGANYLGFLVLLKNLLSGKSLSIAAPASYWYLKGFPIKQMAPILDYIVYMTYDLHGQWDYSNKWSDPGCPGGSCLRSDINVTETINALVMITKAGVPSNKVIVGVTSYGRAYGMTTPGCWTEMCTFQGPASTAEAGSCTGTPGYISDAEIKSIITSPARQAVQYYDSRSQTDIVVWDSTNWVGYMSASTKATRIALYKNLGMGGITDWAIDLEDNVVVPDGISSWPKFVSLVFAGGDPTIGDRTGNWTSLNCDNEYVKNDIYYSSQQRWAALDAADAWQNALEVWRSQDRALNIPFMTSLQHTYKAIAGAQCGEMTSTSSCITYTQCTNFIGDPGVTGPGAWLIWNSLITINNMFYDLYRALQDAKADVALTVNAFNDHFDPLPDNSNIDLILQIILDAVGAGAVFVAAPFFNGFLKELAFFKKVGSDNVKDYTYAALAGGLAIGKDVLQGQQHVDDWTEQNQHDLSLMFDQVIIGWQNIIEQTAINLFNGSEASISQLSTLIGNGVMLPGASASSAPPQPVVPQVGTELLMLRGFYAFAIPTAWLAQGHIPVIVDTGATCGADPSQFNYVNTGDLGSVSACTPSDKGNKLYMLGSVEGVAEEDYPGCDNCGPVTIDNKLTELPGMDQLNAQNPFGGITLQQIITG
jgi:GH18 family chitinase